MKLVWAAILALSLSHMHGDSLEVVVSNERENLLEYGAENYLEALIERNSKEAVILKADKAVIYRENGNKFRMRPTMIGPLAIKVCKLVKNDTVVIGIKEFR